MPRTGVVSDRRSVIVGRAVLSRAVSGDAVAAAWVVEAAPVRGVRAASPTPHAVSARKTNGMQRMRVGCSEWRG